MVILPKSSCFSASTTRLKLLLDVVENVVDQAASYSFRPDEAGHPAAAADFFPYCQRRSQGQLTTRAFWFCEDGGLWG